jgi:hypothetical protein
MLVITRPLTKGIPCAPGEFREIPQEVVRRLTNTEKWTKAMNKMNRHTTLTMTTLAFLWLGIVLLAGKAVGQQAGSILKNQLVGTWMLASNYTDREDGSKIDTFGPNPKGILMLDGDGRLSLQEMGSGLPKFASNNRQEGTADENKAIVQGIICYFGTYTIDEAATTLIFHLEGCSFPNWNGTEQKRSFTLTGDELTWTGVGSSGRPIHTVWKRAK